MRLKLWQSRIVDWFICAVFLLATIAVWMWTPPAKGQATNATAQQVEINSQVAFGLGYQSNQTLMNYVAPGTLTAKFALQTTVFIPPSTTAQAVNLATLFPFINTAIVYGLQDITAAGQAITVSMKSDGTNGMPQAAGGFSEWRVNCAIASAPTLYLTNSDATNYAIVKVFCLAN